MKTFIIKVSYHDEDKFVNNENIKDAVIMGCKVFHSNIEVIEISQKLENLSDLKKLLKLDTCENDQH